MRFGDRWELISDSESSLHGRGEAKFVRVHSLDNNYILRAMYSSYSLEMLDIANSYMIHVILYDCTSHKWNKMLL